MHVHACDFAFALSLLLCVRASRVKGRVHVVDGKSRDDELFVPRLGSPQKWPFHHHHRTAPAAVVPQLGQPRGGVGRGHRSRWCKKPCPRGRGESPRMAVGDDDESFKSSYTVLAGVKHYIRDTGDVGSNPDGPIAILFHGFTGSTDSWDKVAPVLAAGGVRAIAFDRVGFGRTERPIQPRLPAPPPLPFANAIAELLSRGVEQAPPRGFVLPDARVALAIGLEKPSALAPRLPWELTALREDPYSSKFAVSRVLWALLRQRIRSSAGNRKLFLVGHSAGGPLVLRALAESAASASPLLPRGTSIAGMALISPAALDPQEDPDFFESREPLAIFNKRVPLPFELRKALEFQARIAAFRGVLSLPDVFGLQLSRRIIEGGDIEAVVKRQMHPRMGRAEFSDRIAALADKYSAPVREFPDTWDLGLLNVYRADFGSEDSLRGRSLLAAAKDAKRGWVRVLVTTGDVDGIVPPKASKKIAELLEAERFEILGETGHLPMDERPEQLGQMLLDFFYERPGTDEPTRTGEPPRPDKPPQTDRPPRSLPIQGYHH